jgi:tetratricopeptide (TPR) repeat protein
MRSPWAPFLLLVAGCATAPAYLVPDVTISAEDQHLDPLQIAPELIERRETPGSLERAIALLRWHWKRQPESVDLNALLAEAHSRMCESLDLKKPEDLSPHLEHRTAGLYHAREAVQIDAGHAPAQYWLGSLLLHASEAENSLGKTHEALKHLERAEALHAAIDDGGPARLRGRVLQDMPGIFGGSVSNAIACYRRSLEAAPGAMATRLYLGEAYLATDRINLARSELEHVTASRPRPGHEKEDGELHRKAEELLKKLHEP